MRSDDTGERTEEELPRRCLVPRSPDDSTRLTIKLAYADISVFPNATRNSYRERRNMGVKGSLPRMKRLREVRRQARATAGREFLWCSFTADASLHSMALSH